MVVDAKCWKKRGVNVSASSGRRKKQRILDLSTVSVLKDLTVVAMQSSKKQ